MAGVGDADHFDIDFRQFRLRPGLELEIHDIKGRLLHDRAQFVLAHAQDLLIAVPVDSPEELAVVADQRYRINGFNGRFDFMFSAEVKKVDQSQCTVLLAAPASVTIRFVRKYPRLSLSLPATFTRPEPEPAGEGTLKNLSMGGAAIETVLPPGKVGDSVTLHFTITFDGEPEDIALEAAIRRVSESRDALLYSTGLEFTQLGRDQKLLLHYFITTVANEYNLI